MSPGWQPSASQIASSVEKRIARALPVFRMDRFTIVIPTRSASSVKYSPRVEQVVQLHQDRQVRPSLQLFAHRAPWANTRARTKVRRTASQPLIEKPASSWTGWAGVEIALPISPMTMLSS